MAEAVGQFEKRIENLEKTVQEMDKRFDRQEIKIVKMESDIQGTNTRIDNVENMLKEITENTKWIKRTMIKAGITAGFSLLVGAVIALVAFYFNSLGV